MGLRHRAGVPAVFLTLGAGCLVTAAAVAIWVREPPGLDTSATRPTASVLSVLADRRLLRLAFAGFLLVVPQFLGSVFMVEVLHDGAGLPLGPAGGLLALTQTLGAAGRLGNGAWSDRVGKRIGPLQIVAISVAAGFALAAVLEPGPAPLLAAVLVPAAALAISWNGLVPATPASAAADQAAPADQPARCLPTTGDQNVRRRS